MTEALDHYLDQRDEDYERQGEEMIEVEKGYLECLEAELADWHDRRDEKFQMYEDCKVENEALMMASNSLLGLLDCLGSRMSLDDAGSDRKTLAELVDYPNYMNKKLALLKEKQE